MLFRRLNNNSTCLPTGRSASVNDRVPRFYPPVRLAGRHFRSRMSQLSHLPAGRLVGDRGYGTLKSTEYALSKGADYVFRLTCLPDRQESESFNLYNEDGNHLPAGRRENNSTAN
jgi:hypothetical protein